MARRIGLTSEKVLRAATALAQQDGLSAVTLAAVAEQLRVRSPSLYAHFDSLALLHRAVTLQSTEALGATLQASRSGHRGGAALANLARAYLTFARTYPGWYEAVHAKPSGIPDGELYRALAGLVMPIVACLAEMGVAPAEMLHQTRLVRSALHGFASLERSNGFGPPEDFDRSFDRLVAVLVSGVSAGR